MQGPQRSRLFARSRVALHALASFRAKCPAVLLLREAPGHPEGLPSRRLVEPGSFVEESLFDCKRQVCLRAFAVVAADRRVSPTPQLCLCRRGLNAALRPSARHLCSTLQPSDRYRLPASSCHPACPDEGRKRRTHRDVPEIPVYWRNLDNSALACLKIGMSGSASFHSVRKS